MWASDFSLPVLTGYVSGALGMLAIIELYVGSGFTTCCMLVGSLMGLFSGTAMQNARLARAACHPDEVPWADRIVVATRMECRVCHKTRLVSHRLTDDVQSLPCENCGMTDNALLWPDEPVDEQEDLCEPVEI